MLKIKTKILPSNIPNAGIGLFCSESVTKGTLVWAFDEGWDFRVKNFPTDPIMREFVTTYGYLQKDGVPGQVICADNARFFNHADEMQANCIVEADGSTYACKDLEAGTELTCSYDNSFADDSDIGWYVGDGAIPTGN